MQSRIRTLTLIIKMKKEAFKGNNHLKVSEPDTLHNKALTYKERRPRNQLFLGLTNTSRKTRQKPHQLALNRKYTVTEYLSTVIDPKLRKSLRMYRLSEHSLTIEWPPATGKMRVKPSSLPANYTKASRDTFPHITNNPK